MLAININIKRTDRL